MEWMKVIRTAFLSVGALFLITKIMGHKQVSQLDFFDYINGITIGSIAAELATELEQPWKPLLAMAVYGLIAVVLNVITSRIPRSRKYINGAPTILMDGGKLFRENLKKSKLDLSEFMVMCRQQGYFDLSDIQTAVYEFNGRLSILAVSGRRPANPEDLGLRPAPAAIRTEVIMDGRILDDNLKRLGLDSRWLEKRLREMGYGSPDTVFLALCDRSKELTVYPMA